MAGPRKFSEKIALLNQKEAEGNAAFDSIMVEVKSIRPTIGGLNQLEIENITSENKLNYSQIDETIAFEHQKHQQQIQASSSYTNNMHQQNQSKYKKNSNDNNRISQQHAQNQMMSSNTFLQLPNQNDSFRRAHSDSSIHQTLGVNQNSNMNGNLLSPQIVSNYDPLRSSPVQHHFNYQQAQQTTPQTPTMINQQQMFNQYHHSPGSSSYHQHSPSTQPQNHEYNQDASLASSGPLTPTNLNIKPKLEPLTTSRLSPVYNPPQQQLASPTSPTSPTFPSNLYQNNLQIPNQHMQHYNQQQQMQQHQLGAYQHQQQQQQNQMNNNYLNPEIHGHITAGGSLPDLTSFQSNSEHQNIQLQEYNQQRQQLEQQKHQVNKPVYQDQQLLQPGFQQHNHIGPVKLSHHNSVSPTRGISRYSPTNIKSGNVNQRRPSPRRHSPIGDLPFHSANLNSSTLSAQSTPTSPSIPSMQSLPSLEFTINSQQVNNYLLNNGGNGSMMNSSQIPNGVYRSGSNPNGLNGESLPPSPQSQQSCFNSPQGSPGPLSISPQDLNPFSSSNPNAQLQSNNYNYDLMQKKFDMINLDTNSQYNNYISGFNPYTQTPTSPNILPNNTNKMNVQTMNMNGGNIFNNGIKTSNTNKSNIDNNNNGDIGAINSNCSTNGNNSNNSRSASLSSSGSSTNQLNAAVIDEFDLNPIYQQSQTGSQTQHLNMSGSNNSNLTNNSNSSIVNKSHKNSIPNIILTYSGDSIEEKTDLSELIYNQDLLKNEQFDIDLNILSEATTLDDPNASISTINFNDHRLYQSS